MIVGLGVDVVDQARFERAVTRTPRLRERLFAESERGLPVRSLAARFAAKEALVKALGDAEDVNWVDMAIASDVTGNPSFVVAGPLAALLERRGIAAVHVSMSHDAGVAVATVVAEAHG
ncbi:holo-ACP synthase [Protaetiibacter mangrovi]|uniref:Holo-[acyl-carrier-protein] synthase n=1 Tax=Protaetiibacter mangrovi TaxID=2970926 RepID=A0ABT1ZDB6_9MICO|nr:holo-ACP synthase [Protaetiibacter mangrovi]MCS0498685.1 holo-ACP synthase [Protaetiibacter mangrovi]TPX03792.1 holo-ACP synthase [Schumannella luteola]